MIPVMQTKFDIEGNCFAACVASILEVSIDEVPWLKVSESWSDYQLRLNYYLKETHKIIIIWCNYDWFKNDYMESFKDSYYIVSGKIEGELEHSVIYRNDKLIHDSNPKKK